ncbi:MAG: hypothetical protein K2X69_10680 [Silvanigrellaceae bacterium]|nr:hypothetical protein [Silvanigrellaceae bacterium]
MNSKEALKLLLDSKLVIDENEYIYTYNQSSLIEKCYLSEKYFLKIDQFIELSLDFNEYIEKPLDKETLIKKILNLRDREYMNNESFSCVLLLKKYLNDPDINKAIGDVFFINEVRNEKNS